MKYEFLIETYETERIKTLSVWSMFKEKDLPVRPHHGEVCTNRWYISA